MSAQDNEKPVLVDEKPVLADAAELARMHELLKGSEWKATQWFTSPNSAGKMAVLEASK